MQGWGWGNLPQHHNCRLHNVTHTSQRVSMSEWLRAQGLLWMLPFHLWLIFTHFLLTEMTFITCLSWGTLWLTSVWAGGTGASEKHWSHTLTPSPAPEAIKTNGTAALQGSQRETQKITTAQQPGGYLKPTADGLPPPPPFSRIHWSLCNLFGFSDKLLFYYLCSPWSSAEVEKRLLAAAFYSALLSVCEKVAAPDNNSTFFPSLSGHSAFPNRMHLNHFSLLSHIDFTIPGKKKKIKSLLLKGINVF